MKKWNEKPKDGEMVALVWSDGPLNEDGSPYEPYRTYARWAPTRDGWWDASWDIEGTEGAPHDDEVIIGWYPLSEGNDLYGNDEIEKERI